MRRFTAVRSLLLLALSLTAISSAPPALARRRPEPVPEAPPPPPPPPPAAPVGLPERMLEDAAAYEGYMLRIGATSPGFTSAETVSSALHNGASYEPRALVRGAIAFASIAALKDQEFVAALRQAGNSPENRQLIVGYIRSNPAYLLQFKGADVAAGYAQAAIGHAALSLLQTGRLVHQAAYSVQRETWSKAPITNADMRLAEVKALSAGALAPSPENLPVMQRAATLAEPLAVDGTPLTSAWTPMVGHSMQIAAIAALGEAPDPAYDNLVSLSIDEVAAECLERAKRDLYQCLAVSKPNYEDIFCMGQHEMLDPAGCLAQAAAVQLPPEVIAAAPAAMKTPEIRLKSRRRKT